MGHYLQMAKLQQVHALPALGWSYRRIEAETGVRRETVSRCAARQAAKAANSFPGSAASVADAVEGAAADAAPKAANLFPGAPSNAANLFPGSAPARRPGPPAAAAPYRTGITEKLDAGLSVQRNSQDLVEEYGFASSYEAVKRYVRTLERPPRGRCIPSRAWSRRASGLLSRRTDPRRGDGRVAAALGVSHDARELAPWVRGSRRRPNARDLSPPARARLPRLL